MTQEAEQIMKRCQIGTRNYNEANNLHADCYRVIGKLLAEHAMQEVQRLGQEIEQEPKEEKLHPIHIGVDVTKEGTAVTAFYRKPDAVMEMFYSQFHPMAQPEQEACKEMEKNAICSPFMISELWRLSK